MTNNVRAEQSEGEMATKRQYLFIFIPALTLSYLSPLALSDCARRTGRAQTVKQKTVQTLHIREAVSRCDKQKRATSLSL